MRLAWTTRPRFIERQGVQADLTTRQRRASCLWSVAVDVIGSDSGGVGGSEVGAVAGENLDPLLPRVVDRLCDEVGGVGLAASGHADVRRGRAGGLADEQVGLVDGLALGAVHRGGVGELEVLLHIGGWKGALPGSSADRHTAVGTYCGDGPVVSVRDFEVAVVASRRDPVTHIDLLTGARGEHAATAPTIDPTTSLSPDSGVEGGDLIAGVGDDQATHGSERLHRFDLRRAAVWVTACDSAAWR